MLQTVNLSNRAALPGPSPPRCCRVINNHRLADPTAAGGTTKSVIPKAAKPNFDMESRRRQMDAFDSVIGSDSKVRDGVDAAIWKVEGCQICVFFKLDLLLLLLCVAELFTDCGRRRRSDGNPPPPLPRPAPAASLITHTCAYSLIWCVEEG